VIDVAAMLVEELKGDNELYAVVGSNIFGYRIPQNATPPLVLVTVPQSTPVAAPSSSWSEFMCVVDVHSESPALSLAVGQRVEGLLSQVSGSFATAVVSGMRVESNQSVVDDGWTPTRFRQVVTVDVTAREP
jgi:hypothetical protein